MPTTMHLTVLVSLFAVTVCPAEQTTTSAAHHTSLAVTKTNGVTSSTVKTTYSTQQSTTEVTSEKVSSSPSPSTSPQTPNRTEETQPSPHPQTTPTNQTSNETVSQATTLPPASRSPNVTATTTVNTTSPGLSHDWENGDLAKNPGLVAILCIFCIVLALVLVVVTVKCIRSPRSNFERLEDVPMGNVNEGSPFAQYSK